jgi:pimeloyl-ACP methyl ester carboxylesterase
MAATHDRMTEGGHIIINTANGTLEYADVGSCYAVLVVHGAGGGYDQGVLLSKIFFREDNNQIRVIAPSRFGYLHTPLPDNNGSNNNNNNQKSSFGAQADVYAGLNASNLSLNDVNCSSNTFFRSLKMETATSVTTAGG